MCLTKITVCTHGSLFEQIISVFLFRIIALLLIIYDLLYLALS